MTAELFASSDTDGLEFYCPRCLGLRNDKSYDWKIHLEWSVPYLQQALEFSLLKTACQ